MTLPVHNEEQQQDPVTSQKKSLVIVSARCFRGAVLIIVLNIDLSESNYRTFQSTYLKI